ncbi:unnamed protein product [Gordionus sp. m RMFG-2023]
MFYSHIIIVCLLIFQSSVTTYAKVLHDVQTTLVTREPPKDDVKIVYIGPTTEGYKIICAPMGCRFVLTR